MNGQHSRKRPWVAAALGFIYPGLGHVYLRSWVRALLWFGLAIATVSMVVPADVLATTDLSLTSIQKLYASVPLESALAVFVVEFMNMVDAYLLASRKNERVEGGTRCPHCGKELDVDGLEFCHWCTEPLGDPTAR